MCVAIPGKVISVSEPDGISRPGKVVYGNGEPVEIDLAMVPNAGIGDFVIVHSGYAISTLSQAAAEATLDLLE